MKKQGNKTPLKFSNKSIMYTKDSEVDEIPDKELKKCL
jgi:hypothetical protein